MTERTQKRRYPREELTNAMDEIFGGELHAQRLASLRDGVDGALHASQVGVRAIGRGLAVANGLCPKSAIKQVDRLLSNPNMPYQKMFSLWIRFVLAQRDELVVNFDWTEFPESDQSMLFLGLQTAHGRSTPLLWKTFTTSQLKDQRNDHEDELLVLLAELLDEGKKVTVVADRGFSDTKLFSFLSEELNFHYIIRIKKNTYIFDEKDKKLHADEWLGKNGRMKTVKNARVTEQKQPVACFVGVKDKNMKEPWCLVSSRDDLKGSEVKKLYGKRFTIEESFRDLKNHRYGMGLEQVQIKKNERRDALTWLAVLAHTLLTLLGKAGQQAGLESFLGASRKGEFSLFRMGQMLFELMPRMEEKRLRALSAHFEKLLLSHTLFSEIVGVL